MHIEHPYTDLTGGQWVRGNLHTHTTRSDGARPPQEVIDQYASLGHDFLMLSDHDTVADAELYAQLNARGMVLVSGNEISANGPHMLHVNADRRLEPHAQRQLVLNDAAKARGFVIACHPNWFASFNHCDIQQLAEWAGYAGMEVFNGVISWLEGSSYALDKWDMLLSRGRRVWGFANDDNHGRQCELGLGWNVAYVRERTVTAVVDALAAGRFYPSTGVVISDIRVEGRHISIQTQNATRIVAMQQSAKRFAVVDGPRIEVEVPDGATYLRFECWGQREQFAWTQPFFVRA